MAYSKDEVAALIRSFVQELRKDYPVDRVYLYGSYATGRYQDHSDIDVAIISPIVNSTNSLDLNCTIFHRAMRFNVDLEPICFSPSEFEEEYLPIVKEIKQSGVEIATSA